MRHISEMRFRLMRRQYIEKERKKKECFAGSLCQEDPFFLGTVSPGTYLKQQIH